MGPALRLNLQLLICGLSLAAGLAPMKPGDYSISSRDPCPGKASDIENMNKMSSEQLCNKDERNCTVRLDGMQICIDDISACNLKQFPKLRELRVQGAEASSLQEPSVDDFYDTLDEIFCSLPNLTYFSLIGVPLKRDTLFSFETQCPEDCSSNLGHLQLSHDGIHLISPCMGFSLSKLNKLDLSKNFIKSIPSLDIMKRFTYLADSSSQESKSVQVPESLHIDLSNNSLILLPADVFPDRNESAIFEEQGSLHANINLENNPDLMCLPPTSNDTYLETERYIPDCCCNPLKSQFLSALVPRQSECQSSNASVSLAVTQKSVGDDGASTLRLGVSVSGIASSCRLEQPVMMEYSGHAQPRVIGGEQDAFIESCTCQHSSGEQAFGEESSDLVKGFMSFVLKSSLDGFNGSTDIELEIPYPPDTGNFKFCIDKATVNADLKLISEQSLCVDLIMDDPGDQESSSPPAVPFFDSPGSIPPPPFSGNDNSTLSSQSSSSTQSNRSPLTHSSPQAPMWSVLGGGAVILVLILVLGLYKYKRRKQASPRAPWGENANNPEGLELIESGVAVDEIPTDSQPLELNMNRDLRPDTVTRTPPLVTDSLSNLAMLFEYHHQSSYRSRHVVGTAVRPLDDLDDRIVMGVALDHVNL